jgi:uncharacterized membrane protein
LPLYCAISKYCSIPSLLNYFNMCKDYSLFYLCRLRFFLFFIFIFPNFPATAQNLSLHNEGTAIYAKNEAENAASFSEALSAKIVQPTIKVEKPPAPTWLDRKSAQLHKWMGYLSLVLSILLLAINKESRLHRLLGRVFVPCLVVLNVSALVIKVHGFTFFHYLAIASLVIAMFGMIPLMLERTQRSMDLHITCMYASIVAVFTGGVTEALVRIPVFPYYGDLLHSAMVGVPATIFVTVGIGRITVAKKWAEKYVNPLPKK